MSENREGGAGIGSLLRRLAQTQRRIDSLVKSMSIQETAGQFSDSMTAYTSPNAAPKCRACGKKECGNLSGTINAIQEDFVKRSLSRISRNGYVPTCIEPVRPKYTVKPEWQAYCTKSVILWDPEAQIGVAVNK